MQGHRVQIFLSLGWTTTTQQESSDKHPKQYYLKEDCVKKKAGMRRTQRCTTAVTTQLCTLSQVRDTRNVTGYQPSFGSLIAQSGQVISTGKVNLRIEIEESIDHKTHF